MEDTITITIDEYDQLVTNQKLLYALQAYGVDNWCGYDDAVKRHNVENKVDKS